MKKLLLPIYLLLSTCLLSLTAFSQDKASDVDTSAMLNLPGDNLDLAAVLELFQKSKTIEGFEKSLNEEKTKINNLDLDLNKKVDFIKVKTEKEGDSYRFILQVDVSKKETQDVAVILLDKDKSGKISLQIVGDEDLYGKDYVIEPKGNSSVTANPGYTGTDPVKENVVASTSTTVVVQQSPVVQYVYSPAYVPYVPPYYYGYYPPYFAFFTVMAVGIYRSNHWYGHGGYYGGHYHGGGNTVIINNRNSINHYNNNSRNRSTTVSDNMNRGSYGNRTGGNRGSASNRPSAGTSDRSRPSTGASNRPSAGTSDRSRPSTGTSNRQTPSASTRQTPSASTRQASPSTRSSSYGGGGGRSMGGGGGGGFRGGGGGGRRR